ncbi:MAG: hypothetical protein OER82_07160 [Nitrosopumilus sp.]|nr:hypothetical protein [Nitrosopumilus sp.]
MRTVSKELFKHGVAKVGGLEYLAEKTLEWEHTLLKAIQIAPIDARLDDLETQGLIKKRSDKKCLFDYDLTESGNHSLEEYHKILKLRYRTFWLFRSEKTLSSKLTKKLTLIFFFLQS